MTARFRPVAGYMVFVAVLLTVPAVFTRVPFYTLSTAVLMVLLAIGALGLVPLTGLARQVSIGQAAFYGIGGYTSAVLTVRYHVDPWWGLLAGVVLAAAVAWSLGAVIFRAQGHYLSLATLAFGLAVAALVNELPVTGRNAGISGLPPLRILGASLTTDLPFYWLCAGLLLVATVAVHLLLRSPVGSALTAAGDSPIAAAAAGIDISALRRTAFVVSAVLASVAGSGYAHWFRYVDPSMLGLLNSVQLLIIITVGGRESVWGAPLGAFTVVTLAEVVRGRLPGSEAGAELTAYGVVLVLSLLLLPRGLAGLPAALRRRARGAR
ncbi:branched-chain amino acid ABC transporter permease [Actinoplanes sp. TRM 88003]|uniref:Branched-chain amino acid ABC transporter permease n=1 Tax=Paractinoplanes aksuensis TaxID=2939490 RepID=A0ABT1DXG6_9ACTN|nr:branched-chain amino acid ABC transporter permease [Actinoplanes aksuensis]MCO8275460.1 branched-chain amino acid ABC transporter permease [Actinoplanes aksuensis]